MCNVVMARSGASDDPKTPYTHQFTRTEEAITVLFCLIDDAYANLNPPRGRRYESLKRLSDSEVITLALFQHLRGIESERSFLRDAERFFSHLFPGVVGLAPSSFHRRLRKLRCFLEPLRRAIVAELVGDLETLLVDSTLLAVMCILGRSASRRVSTGRRGSDGVPSASTE
jgi:hypothetical protein